ncbi:MAG TPA: TorF family putative porin, partial [Tichowtungia sp.]|nr:TorF family putative porin [Tichowtungia sp.]
MKKIIAGMMVALAAAVSVQAADVSATVDFASAYVFRGVTLNNGLVMQPGVEVSGFGLPEEYGSIAAGIWANYDLDDEDGMGSDFSEIDYYMSYTLPIEALDVSIGYTEYDYPNDLGDNDREVSLSI